MKDDFVMERGGDTRSKRSGDRNAQGRPVDASLPRLTTQPEQVSMAGVAVLGAPHAAALSGATGRPPSGHAKPSAIAASRI